MLHLLVHYSICYPHAPKYCYNLIILFLVQLIYSKNTHSINNYETLFEDKLSLFCIQPHFTLNSYHYGQYVLTKYQIYNNQFSLKTGGSFMGFYLFLFMSMWPCSHFIGDGAVCFVYHGIKISRVRAGQTNGGKNKNLS